MVSPLGAERYEVQRTASKQLHDKLRQTQDLMRHELPNGDVAQVLERALDVLIADRMKTFRRKVPFVRLARVLSSRARHPSALFVHWTE